MNIEEFKISCRSVYPECVFVHHEIPCFDYRLVAEKSFVNELLAARK